MRSLFACIPLVIALSGCADVPQLHDVTSARAIAADYPTLLDIDALDATLTQPRVTDQTGATLSARVANLRARATRLRRAVIEPARRRAMLRAVAARS